MIGLGLACSHAPMAFQESAEEWDSYYYGMHDMSGRPRPKEADRETYDVVVDYTKRIKRGFDALREQIEDYQPDVLIVIGGDQSEQFDGSLKPAFMMYTGGDDVWGYINPRNKPLSEEYLVRYKTNGEVAQRMLDGLVALGFDMNHCDQLQPLAQPQKGMPHAFTRPVSKVLPDPYIPLVLVYENTYDPPSPTGRRCYELGQAIAQVCLDMPERIAILGSGGLSHDPGGPRKGWIDEPLDRWVLDQITVGKGQSLDAMYFPSMTMAGGTGEIRAWITTAGAMEAMGVQHATIVDYVPAYKALTGLAWAYWDRVPGQVDADR